MHPRCPTCHALFVQYIYERKIHVEYGFCEHCQGWFATTSGDPKGIENEFDEQFQRLHRWYASRLT
jgi:hypothetical protein